MKEKHRKKQKKKQKKKRCELKKKIIDPTKS